MALVLDGLDLGTLLLSPMAGVTDTVFRRLCRRMGADTLYTEFVSGDGVVRENARTLEMLDFHPEEHPIGFQIFGGDPEVVAEAARRAWQPGPDLIDINFGCPARKVTRQMAGCAILQDLGLFREVVAAAVAAVPGPVTVKIRAGWDRQRLVHREAARLAAEAGARAIALHPRTRAQGYSGRADWSLITELVASSSIPVIGNGDLFEPEDVHRMLTETGCAAVMIARGAIGNPWIFARTRTLLATGELPPPPDPAERLAMMLEHARLDVDYKGERRGVRELRKHLGSYTRGLHWGARLRAAAVRIETLADLEGLVRDYLAALARLEGSAPEAGGRPDFLSSEMAHAAG
jgi:tRNA-dihydrouridine synthase B